MLSIYREGSFSLFIILLAEPLAYDETRSSLTSCKHDLDCLPKTASWGALPWQRWVTLHGMFDKWNVEMVAFTDYDVVVVAERDILHYIGTKIFCFPFSQA